MGERTHVIGLTVAENSPLKHGETNYGSTPYTFTPTIPFSRLWERAGCFELCKSGTKLRLLGGVRTAISRKRQVGPCVCWLGFSLNLPMGIVSVAPEKITRAICLLNTILSGTTVTFNEYNKFNRLLDQKLVFVGGDRTFMYHLYGRNFHAGLRGGPLTQMIFTPRNLQVLRRWSAGSFFSAALASQ